MNRLIEDLHGDYFCITCAGYPVGHSASEIKEAELVHLREKIDDGADFMITQFFYDAGLFLEYVKDGRKEDWYHTQAILRALYLCNHISGPQNIMEKLDPVKDDDESVKIIGCETTL